MGRARSTNRPHPEEQQTALDGTGVSAIARYVPPKPSDLLCQRPPTLINLRCGEKPIVMPVMLGGESRSTARKIHCRTPSMPTGAIVGVEVNGRWIRACVERIEFAVLRLAKFAASRPFGTDQGEC